MKSRFVASGFAAAAALAVIITGTAVAQGQKAQEAISADQAVECIKAAIAATPGRVESLEVEHEKGQLLCEVEIVADGGAKSEVHVDPATGKVVRGSH